LFSYSCSDCGRWNLDVIFTCISFIAKDDEHFMLSAICTSPENYFIHLPTY
jgi:hypothetical protein